MVDAWVMETTSEQRPCSFPTTSKATEARPTWEGNDLAARQRFWPPSWPGLETRRQFAFLRPASLSPT